MERTRNRYLLLMILPVLAVTYYFAIALPRYNEGRLALERERLRMEETARQQQIQAETARAAAEAEAKRKQEQADAEVRRKQEQDETEATLRATADKEHKEVLLDACKEDAEAKYSEYIRLNGMEDPDKPGVYNAPMYIYNQADKDKQERIDDCYRRYGPK